MTEYTYYKMTNTNVFTPIDVEVGDYDIKIPEQNITISAGLDGGDHLHLEIYPNNAEYFYHKRICGMLLDYHYNTNTFDLSNWINACMKKGFINIEIDKNYADMIFWDNTIAERFELQCKKLGDFY